jgi:predicted dehydrogenase
VFAVAGPEAGDVHVTLRFENGSTGVISYTTAGNRRFPKETLDAAGGGRSARFDNFRQASVWSGRRTNGMRSRGGQDKGQRQQVAAFVAACRSGAAMPISLESLFATTRATIAVGESLITGKPERV